jgi:hypothetical protein
MILTGYDQNILRKPFPSAAFSTTNPTWTGLELNPVLSDVKELTGYGGVISLLSLTGW